MYKMSNDDIVIRLIEPHNYEDVMQFILEHFCPDEPLCSCEPKLVPNENNRNEIRECLKIGTSILAVKLLENGEEELVGVNIGIPREPTCIEEYFLGAEEEGNTKYGNILKFIGIASRKADIFNRYGVEKLFYSYMSCVKTTYRGKGYGTRLKQELVALAKKLDFKLVAVDCSSFYSTRLCERLGWDVVSFFAYADYKDENGRQIFNPPPPHEGLTTLAIRV